MWRLCIATLLFLSFIEKSGDFFVDLTYDGRIKVSTLFFCVETFLLRDVDSYKILRYYLLTKGSLFYIVRTKCAIQLKNFTKKMIQ